jgi:hypothetical protein
MRVTFDNLGHLRRLGRFMHHRVSVFDSDPVSAPMLFEQVHQIVVVAAPCPIALKFENRWNGGQPDSPRLCHARKGSLMSGRTGGATRIFDHIEIEAFGQHVQRGPRHADFGPQARKHDVFASRGANSSAEPFVIPRVHRSPLDDLLAGKHIEQLGPQIAGKTLGFNRRQNRGHSKQFRPFGKQQGVIDQRLAVDVIDAKRHLGLVIDEGDGTIFSGQKSAIGIGENVGHWKTSRRAIVPTPENGDFVKTRFRVGQISTSRVMPSVKAEEIVCPIPIFQPTHAF